MYNFKAYSVNVSNKDNNEYMEAFINVYKDGVYDYIGIPQIYVKANNQRGYFRWCDNQIHEITSARSAAVEVIQSCIETMKDSTYTGKFIAIATGKGYENRKFLEGSAHNILNSLLV